jgi:serine/threonine protein kinase
LSDLIPSATVQAIDIMEKMMSFVPQNRPKCTELMNHPFFEGMAEINHHEASPVSRVQSPIVARGTQNNFANPSNQIIQPGSRKSNHGTHHHYGGPYHHHSKPPL